MKIVFYYLQSGHESWAEQAKSLYVKKITPILNFKLVALKSKSEKRDKKAEKLLYEEKLLIKQIQPNDFLILFDEKGKEFSSSREFSHSLVKALEAGKSRVVFVIGGSYGFSDEVKKRAQLKISLSQMTMNHHVAVTVALEQIYRGLTIWKGLPYHND